MPHYKDLDNKLYFLDSSDLESMLPDGCVEITEEEAADIIQAQIDAQPIVVPAEITIRQGRLGLLAIGKLADIETAISTMDEAAQIEWQYAATVRRDHPIVVELMPLLGLTEDEIDELFVSSSQL